ncbi:UDP-glucose 4-epimerase [Halopelagius inordinatus]|uniref:UDP-glucose 4-epimerase n=1 Tax=Halopelagius inordinatus TaxID=553467 RepID=A0A1I2PUV0_9EURY|nr:NAD-dependent epimerase/dehydratase family protein [Halopelagius inordinatus]SFG17386.1 UDP-glucose 4-epimerase [Halopelagius inordinatus]
MEVHVTGGAGFIGSYLVRSLVEQGHDVTVFDNISRGEVSNLENVLDKIRFVEGDIRNRDELEEAIESPDILYHLAAINGTKNFYDRPYEVLDTNVEGVRNVVDIARKQDVDRLVFSSSSEVYGYPERFPTDEDHVLQIMDPENPRFSYAGSKIIGEQYVVNGADDSSYDYTIVRPHNIYGEAMGYDHVIPEFIEQIVTDQPFTVYGDGEQTRSFCYISDAVDAFVRAGFERGGENQIFNVGKQEEVTINGLADRLFDIAGVHPEVSHIESEELKGSTRRRQPDVSKARELLNYDPAVSLDEGLERTFSWYCEDFTGVELEEWRERRN